MSAVQFDFASLDAITRARQVLTNATVYRARVGNRPAFDSEAEAQAYEAGWHAWHDGLECHVAERHEHAPDMTNDEIGAAIARLMAKQTKGTE